MRLQKRSASTFVAQSAISQISERDLMLLRETARIAPSRRARMDPHSHANSYHRPHRHPAKSEFFHLFEGAVDVVLFDDTLGATNRTPDLRPIAP